jgi:hypothetical protein
MPIIDNRPSAGGGGGGVNSVNGNTGPDVILTKSNIGLSNVDNTSDENKPVSIAQLAVLDLKREVNMSKTFTPNGGAGFFPMDSDYMRIDPLAHSPDEIYVMDNKFMEFDVPLDGFDLGVNGQAAKILNIFFKHIGKSNLGSLAFIDSNSELGNGTDVISIRGLSHVNGYTNIRPNVTIDGPLQGYGYQVNMQSGSVMDSYINAFYDYSNIAVACGSYQSFACGPTIAEIKNNNNYSAFNCNTQIPLFQGNASFNGVNISPTLGVFDDGNFQGMGITPTIADVKYATGLYIDMDSTSASVSKYAAYLKGDVQIDGDLSFSGSLSIGRLDAFGTMEASDGGGVPSSVHGLISQITVPDNSVIANVDSFGINTAALIEIGDDCTLTSGPFGIGFTALGLPAAFKIGENSTLDNLGGAIFALNYDGGSGAGSVVNQGYGGRFVAIPNGITTTNRFYGMWAHAPFGLVGTDNWGVYSEHCEKNYFQGAVKIGGSDVPDAGFDLHVEGDAKIGGTLTVVGGIVGVSSVEFKYTLLAGDILAKEITLPSIPFNASDVRLTVVGGIEQENGADFIVTGDVLSWDALGYEALVEIGDKFIVTYKI